MRGTQLLIEFGADVNQVPRRGDLHLMQTASAPKNNMELAQLLLRHGADPDIKNAEGVSVRNQSLANIRLRTLIGQAKPATAAQLQPEDALDVAIALRYKALCDATRLPDPSGGGLFALAHLPGNGNLAAGSFAGI